MRATGVSAATLWGSSLNCLFLIFSSCNYLKYHLGLFINIYIVYYTRNIQYKTSFDTCNRIVWIIDVFTRETIIFIKYHTNSIRTDIQNMIKTVKHYTDNTNLYNRCSKCLPYGLLDRKDSGPPDRDRIIQPINSIKKKIQIRLQFTVSDSVQMHISHVYAAAVLRTPTHTTWYHCGHLSHCNQSIWWTFLFLRAEGLSLSHAWQISSLIASSGSSSGSTSIAERAAYVTASGSISLDASTCPVAALATVGSVSEAAIYDSTCLIKPKCYVTCVTKIINI